MYWNYIMFTSTIRPPIVCIYMCYLQPSVSQLLSHLIYQDGALSLRAVSMQSAGQYTCHASNSEGNVTRVTKVKIKGQLLPGPPVCLPVFLSLCLSACQFLQPLWCLCAWLAVSHRNLHFLFLALASYDRVATESQAEFSSVPVKITLISWYETGYHLGLWRGGGLLYRDRNSGVLIILKAALQRIVCFLNLFGGCSWAEWECCCLVIKFILLTSFFFFYFF